jgi:hypothetical protein
MPEAIVTSKSWALTTAAAVVAVARAPPMRALDVSPPNRPATATETNASDAFMEEPSFGLRDVAH